MENRSTVVGVDIGGTKISAALFSLNGDIIQKMIQPIGKSKGRQVIKKIGSLLRSLMENARQMSCEVVSIGACIPGIYNPVDETVWAPNISGWNYIPLGDELSYLVENPSIRIVIESDRSCYILGEIWKGCAQGCTDAIFVSVGTGIGAGILSNGRIISGSNGIAGAIGWMALEPPYQKKYDACGNFEHYASGQGLARSAVEIMGESPGASLLDSIPLHKITSHDIFEAFKKQDPVARQVIDKAIYYWGMATANLISIFNPQKVIFGGGVFGPASNFLDHILEEAKKWTQPVAIQEVTLETSTLQGDAGLFGAGYLAIQTIIDNGSALS